MPRASSGTKQAPHGCAGFTSDGAGPGCLSWEREVPPAEPLGSPAYSLTLSARMERGGLTGWGHTWVRMGRVAEEPPAGR